MRTNLSNYDIELIPSTPEAHPPHVKFSYLLIYFALFQNVALFR